MARATAVTGFEKKAEKGIEWRRRMITGKDQESQEEDGEAFH